MVHLSHGVLDLCRHYGQKNENKELTESEFCAKSDSDLEVKKGRLKKLQTHIFHMLL